MSYVLRLGQAHRPLPAYSDPRTGARYEFRCGWCPERFEFAHQLIRHVKKERNEAAS